MKIIYPYNEILPLKKAHDAFVIRNCASLAARGADVTLLCGKGSLSKAELFAFYKIDANNPLKIISLPILRRNNIFHLNWNFVFFQFAKRYIEKHQPDIVIFSVLKLANFLLSRKLKDTRYIYEVHQLNWYPSLKAQLNLNKVVFERSILNRSDLVVSTTDALKEILKVYPYHIQTPITTLPLACDFTPLKDKPLQKPLKLFYVGQLYAKQGLHRLIDALKSVQGIHLYVLGGSALQIQHYESYCQEQKVQDKVTFKGFVSPDQFQSVLSDADAFVTTFENTERMPYVAHTKLYEYLALRKPIIAPNLEIVKEHAPHGVLTYEDENERSLVTCLNELQNEKIYQSLKEEIHKNKIYTWATRGEAYKSLLESLLNNALASQGESK